MQRSTDSAPVHLQIMVGELRGDLNGIRAVLEANAVSSKADREAMRQAIGALTDRVRDLETIATKWENRGKGVIIGAGMVGGGLAASVVSFWQSIRGFFT